MRILLWHVHGSWTTSFVHGSHDVLLPTVPDRGPTGRGRAETWDWPSNAIEVTAAEAADTEVDCVILQRPEELHDLAASWLGGRRPGIDVPAVYVEHNAPQGRINDLRHPVADRRDIPVVHVTHFNAMMWDNGDAPVHVVEHGIVDPGPRYTGELDRAAAVVNEPVRRGRVTGTDLLPTFRQHVPVDLFGMGTEAVGGLGNLEQADLHDVLGRRRLYLHPYRWTSLGLSVLEAMHLAMPVVCLSTTEAPEAIPPQAGIVSNRWDELADGIRRLRADPDLAADMGAAARRAALDRYGLDRFHDDWDTVLKEVTS